MRNAYSFDHFPAINTHSYEYLPIFYRQFFNRWLDSLGEACNTSSPTDLFLLTVLNQDAILYWPMPVFDITIYCMLTDSQPRHQTQKCTQLYSIQDPL